MSAVVAIVGRPNVGKSTLFNRLLGRRVAIVQNEPGVTRDRIEGEVEWQGRNLLLLDTGGLMPDPQAGIPKAIAGQVDVAIAESDVIVFVVDAREGPTALDEIIADRLRRSGKPLLLAVNKVDVSDLLHLTQPFYALGFGEPQPISAEHGLGTGDLLDAIVQLLPPATAGDLPAADPDTIRVVVLGRPNVGKSSLLNKIIGSERVIVSDQPGTTRDSIEVTWASEFGRFTLVDTAGLRRRSRVNEPVEFYSTVRARQALERSDLAIVLFDAQELPTEQDRHIAGMADDAGRALLLCINKWDLVTDDPAAADRVRRLVRRRLPRIAYAPILFISALTGRGVHKIPLALRKIYDAYTLDVATGRLNRILQAAIERHHPPTVNGRRLRIRYATQVRHGPPTFLIFVNDPELVVGDYRRYLENQLRQAFPFEGTPIRLVFRGQPRRDG